MGRFRCVFRSLAQSISWNDFCRLGGTNSLLLRDFWQGGVVYDDDVAIRKKGLAGVTEAQSQMNGPHCDDTMWGRREEGRSQPVGWIFS
jgi:hypothetical protein